MRAYLGADDDRQELRACSDGVVWVMALIELYVTALHRSTLTPNSSPGGRGRAGAWGRMGATWSRGPACGDATVEPIVSASPPILCASARSDPQRGPSSALRRAPFTGCDRGGALKNAAIRRVASRCGGRWSVEQGPRLRGCDRGTGHERVATVPMHVFAVRSPEGPLFRAATRTSIGKPTDPVPPSAVERSAEMLLDHF